MDVLGENVRGDLLKESIVDVQINRGMSVCFHVRLLSSVGHVGVEMAH